MSSNENWSSSNVLIVPLTTCFIVATFRHCLKNRNGELKRIGGRNSFPKWERVRAPFLSRRSGTKGTFCQQKLGHCLNFFVGHHQNAAVFAGIIHLYSEL